MRLANRRAIPSVPSVEPPSTTTISSHHVTLSRQCARSRSSFWQMTVQLTAGTCAAGGSSRRPRSLRAVRVAERAGGRASGPAAPPPVGLRQDLLPTDVGGRRVGYLAGQEEASAKHAEAAILDRGDHVRGGEAVRGQPRRADPGTGGG